MTPDPGPVLEPDPGSDPGPDPGPGPDRAAGPVPEAPWQRLDPRMLLVQPVQELLRFLPVLIGILVAGRATGGRAWELFGVLVPIVLGVLRYLTTRYRVHHGVVELRRGLLSRTALSTRLDRVRTVDLTASIVHRLVGLTTMRIGTGSADDDGLTLDGLPVAVATRLREELLSRGADARAAAGGDAGGAGDLRDRGVAAPPEPDVLRLDPTWARYAPLTGGGLLVVAAVLGAVAQGLDAFDVAGRLDLRGASATVPALLVLLLVAVAGTLAVSALAVAGYLVTNWQLRIRRTPQGWQLTRGALTTRATTLDEARVAGVTVSEPVGLRAAGAATVGAIVTGLDREQRGSATLVPAAPYAVVAGVAGRVLGTHAPLAGALAAHGPRAARRRWSRALAPAFALAAVGLGLVALTDVTRWLLLPAGLAVPVAAWLARDRSRNLGHALVDGHLVARQGSLVRRSEVLRTDAVIGWVLRETWWQRRAGLTTLVATTAGGDQAVEVLDLPAGTAVALADDAVPRLVAQFRR